ncbi:hypothetical protein SARC_06682 [Sphaeroforma arctica JP610]|uniref:Uncharacterized protein n=1 Tax=Sphaeroforma arctica JP610 TaxID=667725 RepID=A0A0L0FVV4_9EUKA|nr:hypothetical protein SARC_06682 [Sphaeroforma arctica JP610]KNC80967.1 hypothetical protein SARC_06682 [Sphaeroforma arctica JP610]|eukprot:XP_014154869.1 hypothetical protein SARC_06682 [Sphaeroforma arctica JP610]
MVSSIRRRIPKPSNPAAADGSKRRSLTADLGNTINRTIKGAGRTVGGGVEKVAKGLSLPSLRSNNTSPSASADELPQLPTEMCTAPTGEKEKKFLRKRNHMRIATILYDRQHKKDSPVAITTPRAAENEPDFDLSFAG